jgi:hypothetical protein
MGLCLFIVADPFDLGFERPAGTKHMPLLLSLVGLVIASVGHALRSQGRAKICVSWSLLRAGYPLVMLGAWVLAGGFYTRFVDHIQDSFMTTGLYMLATFSIARAIILCDAHEKLIASMCRMIALATAFMILRMIVQHIWSGGMYHEMEFLVIPVAVFFALRPSGSPMQRKLITLFFLFGAVTFLKNTAFIVLFITLLYLWWVEWRFHFKDPARVYRYIVGVMLAIAVAITLLAVLGNAFSEVTMPTGNPGYRMRTYDRAIARFYESPVWGTLFASRSTARFTAFEISVAGGQLPTHSDVLDIAANGGIIALGLLAWGYARIARVAGRTLLRGRVRNDMAAAAHMFACMSVSGIAVYAFNPIMLQPEKALLLWGSLGMLLGCCLHAKASSPLNLVHKP